MTDAEKLKEWKAMYGVSWRIIGQLLFTNDKHPAQRAFTETKRNNLPKDWKEKINNGLKKWGEIE